MTREMSLEVVEEIKLLGIMIRSDMKWTSNTRNGGITQRDKWAIKIIQMTALATIKGDQYTSYPDSLTYFGTKTLDLRRVTLILKFALKVYKSPQFLCWLTVKKKLKPTKNKIICKYHHI